MRFSIASSLNRAIADPPPTGRLAPSPTGGLHLGHARTFLVAWLACRSRGGRLVYRVEDLDAGRVRGEATAGAMADLRWLGLDWDAGPDQGGPDGPYLQSARGAIYEAALAELQRRELVYPCTCTRADIERAASAPHPEDEGPTYPGTCAPRSSADAASLTQSPRPFAWRFRVPVGRVVTWDDGSRGPLALTPARLGGDFVVARAGVGGAITTSYQLAVVVDDGAMGVDQVVRGDDLVPSTPRQILLHEALGQPIPAFSHLPLALGPDGRRLAKRDGALKLATLRELGVDPRRLVGLLAHSCGWGDRVEPLAPADLLRRFDLGRIPATPWTVPGDLLELVGIGRG